MGRPDGAHTHGGGGGVLGEAALVVLAVAAVAAVAVPVINALTHLLEVLAVIVGALIVLGSVGLVLFLRWQARPRQPSRVTAVAYRPPLAQGPAQALTEPRRPVAALPVPQPREAGQGQHVHFHFHGMSAEDVVAIIAQQETSTRGRE